jgi:hypothetical protein
MEKVAKFPNEAHILYLCFVIYCKVQLLGVPVEVYVRLCDAVPNVCLSLLCFKGPNERFAT